MKEEKDKPNRLSLFLITYLAFFALNFAHRALWAAAILFGAARLTSSSF